jgi:hypothetical protein
MTIHQSQGSQFDTAAIALARPVARAFGLRERLWGANTETWREVEGST